MWEQRHLDLTASRDAVLEIHLPQFEVDDVPQRRQRKINLLGFRVRFQAERDDVLRRVTDANGGERRDAQRRHDFSVRTEVVDVVPDKSVLDQLSLRRVARRDPKARRGLAFGVLLAEHEIRSLRLVDPTTRDSEIGPEIID